MVEVLHHQKFVLPEGHLLPDEYDVVWCPKCGLAYADTSAGQQDYDRYYAEFSKYEDNKTSTGGGGSDWDSSRLRETASAIAESLPNRQARIVDIGCANGGLLIELQKLGYTDLLGIDPSPACVAHTAGHEGIGAVVGALRHLPRSLGKFEAVILSHVLEHVRDLQSTMNEVAGLMQRNGLLYAEVPDASRYVEFLVAPFQDFNTEHINHFAVASLTNLITPHGFSFERGAQKEVASSPGCPYPAVYGFFRYTGEVSKPSLTIGYQVPPGIRQHLRDYVVASREKIARIDENLSSLARGGTPLIVWGTGQLTMKLLAETSLARTRISAFVDGNPINQGKTLLAVPVLSPEEITDREAPILIATLLHQREIAKRIREELKLPNPLITLD